MSEPIGKKGIGQSILRSDNGQHTAQKGERGGIIDQQAVIGVEQRDQFWWGAGNKSADIQLVGVDQNANGPIMGKSVFGQQ